MRTTFIVTYDIADEKRLRRVFKACKNFGNHLQFSVFECDLSPSERVQMESELKALIHHADDQVLFIALGPAETRGSRVISALGKSYTKFDAACYVV
jgi:CRISPR-associated protein Cas2